MNFHTIMFCFGVIITLEFMMFVCVMLLIIGGYNGFIV